MQLFNSYVSSIQQNTHSSERPTRGGMTEKYNLLTKVKWK